MIVIGGIALILLLLALKGGTGTAILAPGTPGVKPTPYDSGLNPIDVGGQTVQVPPAVLQWRELANTYAEIYSILNPEEILAIIWNESSGNQNAIHPNDQPDGSGSYGLMQVSLSIGKHYAPDDVVSTVDLLNADTNVKAGAGFLSDLKNKYGDNPNWVAAYNEGETQFRKGVADQKYVDAFNLHVISIQELG